MSDTVSVGVVSIMHTSTETLTAMVIKKTKVGFIYGQKLEVHHFMNGLYAHVQLQQVKSKLMSDCSAMRYLASTSCCSTRTGTPGRGHQNRFAAFGLKAYTFEFHSPQRHERAPLKLKYDYALYQESITYAMLWGYALLTRVYQSFYMYRYKFTGECETIIGKLISALYYLLTYSVKLRK